MYRCGDRPLGLNAGTSPRNRRGPGPRLDDDDVDVDAGVSLLAAVFMELAPWAAPWAAPLAGGLPADCDEPAGGAMGVFRASGVFVLDISTENNVLLAVLAGHVMGQYGRRLGSG